MTARYKGLRSVGFAPDVALVLAEAGFDVLGFASLGWLGLPIDEHLKRVGGASC